MDAKNGFMFVLSGVSADKYEIAKDTIIAEFEKFQHGEFDDDKLELAKKVIISQRQESHDRPKSIIEILNNNILLDEDMSETSFIEGIQNVSRTDIQQLAQETILDTIYILTKGSNVLMNEKYYKQIDEKVYEAELNNGLKLFIIPKKGFEKTFVTYTTQFGSLDNKFKPHGSDTYVTVPVWRGTLFRT